MSRTTKSFLSSLAVLAATSAASPADGAVATELLRSASRSAAPLSRCAASTDDLVGDVALRLWSRHRDVLRSRDFRRYVETCVRNARRDQIRRRRGITVFSDLSERDAGAGSDSIVSASEDAHSLAATREFRTTLSPSDRDVLGHLEAGQTDREIARLMSRTRHWVRASVQRIRQQARAYFCDHAPADGSSAATRV